MKFNVTLQKESHEGYVARCLELPGALSEGDIEEETLANIKDAILTIIDMMKEQGESVPTEPADVREPRAALDFRQFQRLSVDIPACGLWATAAPAPAALGGLCGQR